MANIMENITENTMEMIMRNSSSKRADNEECETLIRNEGDDSQKLFDRKPNVIL